MEALLNCVRFVSWKTFFADRQTDRQTSRQTNRIFKKHVNDMKTFLCVLLKINHLDHMATLFLCF